MFAAAAEDSKDSGISRQQADEILHELKEIRKLLEGVITMVKPPAQGVQPSSGRLKLDVGYSLGSDRAPITIVEFTDYQCPFCRQFESTTLAELRKAYIDAGRVRLVVLDLPLDTIHPNAMRAAEAAHCAGDQGKFWPMHNALFGDQGKLDKKGLNDSAQALNLDMTMFRSCLENEKPKQDILNEVAAASALHIVATPSFLIGKMTGNEVNGVILAGAQPFNVFEAKIHEIE